MTPAEHREAADRLTEETGAMLLDSNPMLMNTRATLALSHALLAGAAKPTARPPMPWWEGLLILTLLCGTVLAVVWMVAG